MSQGVANDFLWFTISAMAGTMKKPAASLKTKAMQIRFTPEQMAAVEAVAARSMLAPATWARLQLLKAAGMKANGS